MIEYDRYHFGDIWNIYECLWYIYRLHIILLPNHVIWKSVHPETGKKYSQENSFLTWRTWWCTYFLDHFWDISYGFGRARAGFISEQGIQQAQVPAMWCLWPGKPWDGMVCPALWFDTSCLQVWKGTNHGISWNFQTCETSKVDCTGNIEKCVELVNMITMGWVLHSFAHSVIVIIIIIIPVF